MQLNGHKAGHDKHGASAHPVLIGAVVAGATAAFLGLNLIRLLQIAPMEPVAAPGGPLARPRRSSSGRFMAAVGR